MFVQERHAAILGHLSAKPQADVGELQSAIGVSRSTLRRDLIELEHLGKLVRTHGGVAAVDATRGEPSFDLRRGRAVEQKRAIAATAARWVEPLQTAYLDAGTTCLEVARRLFDRRDVRLFTHSLKIAVEAVHGLASLTCVGGEVRPVSEALVGGLAESWFGRLTFDIAFLAASGVTADGLSTTEMSECAMKEQIIARSRRVVLVADASKWNAPAAVQFARWPAVKKWIVDRNLPSAAAEQVTAAGSAVVWATESD